MTAYQFWRHKALAETYAVRLQGRRITGVHGPLEQNPDRDTLPYYDYDADASRCGRLEEREGEFLLLAELLERRPGLVSQAVRR